MTAPVVFNSDTALSERLGCQGCRGAGRGGGVGKLFSIS
jgi:hypothetical protein